MPRKKTSPSRLDPPQAAARAAHVSAWAKLTWEELDQAFDRRSVQRGLSYQQGSHVKNLAVSDDGHLLATVQGTHRYATSVRLDAKKKSSSQIVGTCSCPVGLQCKHAVAVIAECITQIADGKSLPTLADDDARWDRLANPTNGNYEDHDWNDEDAWDEQDTEVASGLTKKARSKKRRRTRAEWDALIRADIEKKSVADLADFVMELVNRFPELRKEFQERLLLTEGDAPRLIKEARKELRSVTSELGWQNHWQNDGHTPDYSRLQHRLERLVELGHADAVVDLGRELIERGMDQVVQADDEGETGIALAECFPVVFTAVTDSSLTPVEKILFAIDAYELDQWDYVDESAAKILNERWKQDDWSVVADTLVDRLNPPSQGNFTNDDADEGSYSDCSRNYRRDSLSSWIARSLEKAGREDEILPLYEAEVRRTNSYERLVDHLMKLKRFDDAERWALEGIERTREKWPGVATRLADKLVDRARRRKQWGIIASRAACEFFERPSVKAFQDLVRAAEKAKCGEVVRQRAKQFLETGTAPIRCEVSAAKAAKSSTKKKGAKRKIAMQPSLLPSLKLVCEKNWPLPLPDYLAAAFLRPPGRYGGQRSHCDVLIDLAIAEKNPDEALRWYDAILTDEKAKSGSAVPARILSSAELLTDRVAAAVAKTHPGRAIELYHRELERHLPHASRDAYESAATCLRKMRQIMKSLDRDDYWEELVKDIREKYRNRPRFMEILDKLQHRTIIASQKRRR